MNTTIILATLLLCIHSLAYAGVAPRLPYVHYGICEGEDCGKQAVINVGKTTSSLPLHVRKMALQSKVSFVIPKDAEFEVLGYNLYTVKSQPYALDSNEAESCNPKLPAKAVVYVLYCAGERYFKVWHRGQTTYCDIEDHLSKKAYTVELWYHVRYNGHEGWWKRPAYCFDTGNDASVCPSF